MAIWFTWAILIGNVAGRYPNTNAALQAIQKKMEATLEEMKTGRTELQSRRLALRTCYELLLKSAYQNKLVWRKIRIYVT